MSERASESAVEARAGWVLIAQLVALLVMILVTFRLWWPQEHLSTAEVFAFPSVPVFGLLESSGLGVQRITVGFLMLAIVLALVVVSCTRGKRARGGLMALVTVLLLAAVLFNQHRFLPWVYQSMLIFAAAVLLSRFEFFKWCRLILVTIYLFSAISKFDYQFITTTGRTMFHTLTGWIGLESPAWDASLLNFCVFCLPCAEMLIGLGLCFSATRATAVVAGFAMHVSLLLILGPLGLGHAESVLVWNGLLIFQLGLLYWPVKRNPSAVRQSEKPVKVSVTYRLMVILLLAAPVLEKLDLADHWPAWELYAPRTSRCRIWIVDWKIPLLPSSVQKHVRAKRVNSDGPQLLRELDLSRWSIDSLNVPVYPQDRFQLGVAIHIVKRLNLEQGFQVKLQSAANRWTGERKTLTLTNLKALQEKKGEFWLK
ncbi:MAG: hypothetical protein VX438_06040 [Planctomycetota bacterium]|nr:hypothetical protein [Planctomycetota bacterium]